MMEPAVQAKLGSRIYRACQEILGSFEGPRRANYQRYAQLMTAIIQGIAALCKDGLRGPGPLPLIVWDDIAQKAYTLLQEHCSRNPDPEPPKEEEPAEFDVLVDNRIYTLMVFSKLPELMAVHEAKQNKEREAADEAALEAADSEKEETELWMQQMGRLAMQGGIGGPDWNSRMIRDSLQKLSTTAVELIRSKDIAPCDLPGNK